MKKIVRLRTIIPKGLTRMVENTPTCGAARKGDLPARTGDPHSQAKQRNHIWAFVFWKYICLLLPCRHSRKQGTMKSHNWFISSVPTFSM